MKVPQRKNHRSMTGDELLQKVADQTYGKPISNMLSAIKDNK